MKSPSYLRVALALALPTVLYGLISRRYVWLPSYFRVGLTTTLNIALNAMTLGRYVRLEGRVRGGVFKNWAGRFRYRPQRIVRPTTEDEIVELVKNSRSLRVFGSGHSFNSGCRLGRDPGIPGRLQRPYQERQGQETDRRKGRHAHAGCRGATL